MTGCLLMRPQSASGRQEALLPPIRRQSKASSERLCVRAHPGQVRAAGMKFVAHATPPGMISIELAAGIEVPHIASRTRGREYSLTRLHSPCFA